MAPYPLPPVCRSEVLRYAGCCSETPELSALLTQTILEAQPLITPGLCWQSFPLKAEGNVLDFTFASTDSPSLARHLSGCERVVVFAATVGLPIDRLIYRYGKTAPAKALLLQAIGAERIEALCDSFQEQIRQEAAKEGLSITSRFSPGYGDLPLAFQQEIFRILDCPRKIGLTLNDSLLMSPSKSVTAIIGIGMSAHMDCAAGCARCAKTDCIHRRTL